VLKTKYLRFGNFRLYPTEHLLLRDEISLPLAPKAFDILLYLVQNSGHLVKREALMEAVWPDSFVEDTNLTVNVSLLRKDLGRHIRWPAVYRDGAT
jgi:DNA-binding winged helix-turn-helix (wHTH) protein